MSQKTVCVCVCYHLCHSKQVKQQRTGTIPNSHKNNEKMLVFWFLRGSAAASGLVRESITEAQRGERS